MWFCTGPASKIIKNISTLHKKQVELDDELNQTNAKLCSVELEVKRSVSELDGNISDNKHEIDEIQKSDMNAKLQVCTR